MQSQNNNCIANQKKDDGTLAFLNLPKNPNSKWFHCKEIEQSVLKDKTFYVLDYRVVKTRYGEGRVVIKVAGTTDASDEKCRKFISNSSDIKYVLEQIREKDAFPRKVTLRKHEIGGFYFQ